jgi:hypothetical protein
MHPRFGTINLRLVSARLPLGAALSADLAPLINGALVVAELCIFSAQRNFYGFRRVRLLLAARPFETIGGFPPSMFLLGLLALDLSPAPHRYQAVSKTGIKREI